MLDVLSAAQNLIIENFETYKWLNPDEWNSIDVTYKEPHVERLWRQMGENRIYLHKIHRSQGMEREFFHFHPWPAAMRVVSGSYNMKFGYGPRDSDNPPNIILSQILQEGTCYSMEDPLAWHSVQPRYEYSLSIMVTGKPFELNEKKPKCIGALPSLSAEAKKKLLIEFNSFMVTPK